MPTQKELDTVYIHNASRISKLSKGIRLKVGAVAVTRTGICIPGYNGLYAGCPDDVLETQLEDGSLVSKPHVLHAELNCILKAAREGVSLEGCTMYITHAPCVHCAAMMANAGIRRVVYKNHYKNNEGVDLLEEAGIVAEFYKKPYGTRKTYDLD